MRRYRFYLENFKKERDNDEVVIFDKRIIYQVKTVLRMKKGDKIFVFFWAMACLPVGKVLPLTVNYTFTTILWSMIVR